MTDVSQKRRFPAAVAKEVARELCRALKPVTSRLIVAGSLRRRKEAVGDLEILYVPILEQRPEGLFDFAAVNLVDELLNRLLAERVLEKRTGPAGGTSWGPLNKFAVHCGTALPVDLFAATEANWWNYLVCRTGPGNSNIRIAEAARRMGWKWHPCGSGFDRGGDMTGLEYEERIMHSEREVFEFVGLPFREPWERE